MTWLDIAKLAIPAALCAYFLGLRTSTACLVGMVAGAVFGLGLFSASNGGQVPLGDALAKVGHAGPPLFLRMSGAGAIGILGGWGLRRWVKMARASRMTGEARSPI